MFRRYTYLIMGEVMLALIFIVFIFSCVRVMKGDIQNGNNLVSLQTSKDSPYDNDYFVYFEKHVLIDKNLEFCIDTTKEDLDKSEVCSVDSLGWLYKETNEFIVILADKDTNNEDDLFGRSQVIPRGVIKDIKYLS